MFCAEMPVRVTATDNGRPGAQGTVRQAVSCILSPFHSTPMGDPDDPDLVIATSNRIFGCDSAVYGNYNFQGIDPETRE